MTPLTSYKGKNYIGIDLGTTFSAMAYLDSNGRPVTILSDTGDERVTVSQSYKLYHALKDNKVEVQFIVYPVSGHFPSDPVHTRDLRRRWVEWIAQHFE